MINLQTCNKNTVQKVLFSQICATYDLTDHRIAELANLNRMFVKYRNGYHLNKFTNIQNVQCKNTIFCYVLNILSQSQRYYYVNIATTLLFVLSTAGCTSVRASPVGIKCAATSMFPWRGMRRYDSRVTLPQLLHF